MNVVSKDHGIEPVLDSKQATFTFTRNIKGTLEKVYFLAIHEIDLRMNTLVVDTLDPKRVSTLEEVMDLVNRFKVVKLEVVAGAKVNDQHILISLHHSFQDKMPEHELKLVVRAGSRVSDLCEPTFVKFLDKNQFNLTLPHYFEFAKLVKAEINKKNSK